MLVNKYGEDFGRVWESLMQGSRWWDNDLYRIVRDGRKYFILVVSLGDWGMGVGGRKVFYVI